MCEGAIVSILTLPGLVNVGATKLSLVLIRVIKFLDSVMGFLALFSFLTLSAFSYADAHL